MKVSTALSVTFFASLAGLLLISWHLHESHPGCAVAKVWAFWLTLLLPCSAVGWAIIRDGE